MGNGIAQVFATCGFAVELVDLSAPALEKAMSTIARNLDRVVAKGGLDHESRDAALARITAEPLWPKPLTKRIWWWKPPPKTDKLSWNSSGNWTS
jgi:hypothetical protein